MANKKNRTTDREQPNVDLFPEDDEVITLQDEQGNDVNFYQVACVELDGEFYALLQPAEPMEGVAEDEAWIFHLVEEDEESDLFEPVEDEELLQRVFDEYLKAVANSETAEDEE